MKISTHRWRARARNLAVLFLAVFFVSTELNAHRDCHQRAASSPGNTLRLLSGTFLVCGGYLLYKLWPAKDAGGTEEQQKYYREEASGGQVVLHATSVLRFPHMLSDLLEQEERLARNDRARVLVLGAGIQTPESGFVLTFIHEVAAVFPAGDLDIVDLDDRIANAIEGSRYDRTFARTYAEKIVRNPDNFSRFALDSKKASKARRCHKRIAKLVQAIPLKMSQQRELKIKVEAAYFENHKPAEKYDYIIATKSVLYPLARDKLPAAQKRQLVNKYLKALKGDGRMYVDYQTFLLMKWVKVDLRAFKTKVLEHNSSYNNPSDCVGSETVDDYRGCLNGDRGRIGSTEDIVVIARR